MEETEKKQVIVPVNPKLSELLKKSEHELHKGTDRFIIAPEIIKNRVTNMKNSISRGFHHFYKQVEPEGNLTFKSLRKTYLTGLQLYMGNSATVLTHSNQDVVDKHYVDKQKIAEKAKDFVPFADEERQEKLEQVRQSKKQQSKELER